MTSGRSGSPAVSVVMAVYNGEPHLREAVGSILQQSFTDFEFIIVDDGSTDSTWPVLQRFQEQDGRIVLLRTPRNRGLIEALNQGMSRARGRLIARMDADDISHETRLEEQVHFLHENPDVGLLGSGYLRLYDSGRYSRHCPPTDHTTIRWRLFFGNVWPHPAVTFRRDLISGDRAVYREYLHAEDYELWARLARRTRAATLEKPLITIRTRESEGLSATNAEAQDDMVLHVSCDQLNRLDFQERPITHTEAELYRDLANPEIAGRRHLPEATRMFPVFDAFARQSGIDSATVRRLRRSWIRRTLRGALAGGRFKELRRSGFLGQAFRVDPLVFSPPIPRLF